METVERVRNESIVQMLNVIYRVIVVQGKRIAVKLRLCSKFSICHSDCPRCDDE